MHFMLQKEVGKSSGCRAESKAYGRLSVMAQYYCVRVILVLKCRHSAFAAAQSGLAAVRLVPHANVNALPA